MAACVHEVEGADVVLVAGDPERQHMAMCDSRGGIPYHQKLLEFAVGVRLYRSVAERKWPPSRIYIWW